MKKLLFILTIILISYIIFLKKTKTDSKNPKQITAKSLEKKEASNKPAKIIDNYSKRVETNKNNQMPNEVETFNDLEYEELIKKGKRLEAVKHIVHKSEENIGQAPTEEDFFQKLTIMKSYIKRNPELLKVNFDFFISYYTLNAFKKDFAEIESMDSLVTDYYKKNVQNSPYCLEYFKEVSAQNVDYEKLSRIVFNCAKSPQKRSIIYDYTNFLKENNKEVLADQEYMKLKILYPELSE